jgi:exopolyphosphatase/guanosine-5'-triphosphate,3'-diphosphate pyrophosphatase
MLEEMEVYDSARVHGSVVARADVDDLLAKLSAMTLEERKAVVGLDPGRAPVIVAGLLILQQIMEVADMASFTVSERDILHGIILDAAAN